jgi:hypothetical protein
MGLLISGRPFLGMLPNPPEGRVEDFDSLNAFSAFDSDFALGRVFVFGCEDFSVISLLNDEIIKRVVQTQPVNFFFLEHTVL